MNILSPDLLKVFVEGCLYVKSSFLGKKVIMLDMYGICCEPELFCLICDTMIKKVEKYKNDIDLVGIRENCGLVLGSVIARSIRKPMILLTEKDIPGFRPNKFDLGAEGKRKVLVVDAMIETGVHLGRTLRRIEKKGGVVVAIVVTVNNDLATKERILDTKVPIEYVLELSEMKHIIDEVHGKI